jgi:hypothetical protein
VGKVSSWLLLVIVSFLIVATLKLVKERQTPASNDFEWESGADSFISK